MKYKLYFAGKADLMKSATSKRKALAIARQVLGVDRVYRGSEYITDEPDGEDRRSVEALDVWASRSNARRDMDACADCVITW